MVKNEIKNNACRKCGAVRLCRTKKKFFRDLIVCNNKDCEDFMNIDEWHDYQQSILKVIAFKLS